MSAGKRFLRYRLPLFLYLALIFYFSSGPVESATLREVPDYFLHAAEYCVLYLLMFRGIHLGLEPVRGRGGYLLAALLTVLYGISDEFHQRFVPTRVASVGDVLADAIGAFLGIPALFLCRRLISFFRFGGSS